MPRTGRRGPLPSRECVAHQVAWTCHASPGTGQGSTILVVRNPSTPSRRLAALAARPALRAALGRRPRPGSLTWRGQDGDSELTVAGVLYAASLRPRRTASRAPTASLRDLRPLTRPVLAYDRQLRERRLSLRVGNPRRLCFSLGRRSRFSCRAGRGRPRFLQGQRASSSPSRDSVTSVDPGWSIPVDSSRSDMCCSTHERIRASSVPRLASTRTAIQSLCPIKPNWTCSVPM
jgi:hypothetical protein